MSPRNRRPASSRSSPPRTPAASRAAAPGAGRVRIIGGEWRGRQLAVADVAGLRPTGDRVRETLFNWLQFVVPGSRCLDLFAGSGALGLEAASRGAVDVRLIERDPRACAAIERSLDALGRPPQVSLICGSALDFLSSRPAAPEPFDIVFIDPPFDDACQLELLEALADGHLAHHARVYVEAPARQPWPEALPGAFTLERERTFGEVSARLCGHS